MVLPIMEFFDIKPDFNFDIMKPGQSLNDIALSVMANLKPIIEKIKPTHIVVQGDTTSAAIASLLAFYQSIEVVHVEAGLRTYDMTSPWPEEFNRRLIGLASKWHFTPTPLASSNLIKEGVSPSQIYMVGNSGLDALRIASERLRLQEPEIQNRNVFKILVTLHRRESFGQEMRDIMGAIKKVVDHNKQVIVRWPIHQNPNVRQSFQDVFGEGHSQIQTLRPMGYPEFIVEMMSADLIVTDSGGIQEEAPFLGKPILVCRQNTERPEAVECGSARLVGTTEEKIVKEIECLLDKKSERYRNMAIPKTPFGDGYSSQKILDVICPA